MQIRLRERDEPQPGPGRARDHQVMLGMERRGEDWRPPGQLLSSPYRLEHSRKTQLKLEPMTNFGTKLFVLGHEEAYN